MTVIGRADFVIAFCVRLLVIIRLETSTVQNDQMLMADSLTHNAREGPDKHPNLFSMHLLRFSHSLDLGLELVDLAAILPMSSVPKLFGPAWSRLEL